MIRSTLVAAVLGMLAAGPALYLVTTPARQDLAPAPPGAHSAVAEVAIPVEAWPICSSMGSMVESADWAALDPDFAAGKRAIVAGDWNGAINALTSAGLRDDRNADIQTILATSIAACGSSIRPCGSISRHSRSILGTAARTNTSAKPTWCKAISPKPKRTSRHWREFASSPARNTMI